MGYQTKYKLSVVPPKIATPIAIIAELRQQNQEVEYAIDGSGQTLDSVKWYDHESDMLEFSKCYPSHIFILDGVGEDGKQMRKYFFNGKMQDAKPVTVYEDFDTSKLK